MQIFVNRSIFFSKPIDIVVQEADVIIKEHLFTAAARLRPLKMHMAFAPDYVLCTAVTQCFFLQFYFFM